MKHTYDRQKPWFGFPEIYQEFHPVALMKSSITANFFRIYFEIIRDFRHSKVDGI